MTNFFEISEPCLIFFNQSNCRQVKKKVKQVQEATYCWYWYLDNPIGPPGKIVSHELLIKMNNLILTQQNQYSPNSTLF